MIKLTSILSEIRPDLGSGKLAIKHLINEKRWSIFEIIFPKELKGLEIICPWGNPIKEYQIDVLWHNNKNILLILDQYRIPYTLSPSGFDDPNLYINAKYIQIIN